MCDTTPYVSWHVPTNDARNGFSASMSVLEPSHMAWFRNVYDGHPKSIVCFDDDNKRKKQIDLDGRHGPGAHVHRGYYHDECSPKGKPTGLLQKEREMVERVFRVWENRTRKQ